MVGVHMHSMRFCVYCNGVFYGTSLWTHKGSYTADYSDGDTGFTCTL